MYMTRTEVKKTISELLDILEREESKLSVSKKGKAQKDAISTVIDSGINLQALIADGGEEITPLEREAVQIYYILAKTIVI